MLWYKAWLDTRWRFLIGLGLLTVVALANVLSYPYVQGVMELALKAGSSSPVAHEIDRAAQLSSSFRGYVWAQVVHENLIFLWALFAVLLGADGPFSQRSGAVFTLSLPVSRRRLFTVRAATDLAELLLLALVPMLLIPLMAPVVGQSYAPADALVYSVAVFLGGAVFYCMTLLMSTLFEDRWKSIVLALAIVVVVQVCKDLLPAVTSFTPAGAMDGESYFRTGTLAWTGIAIWVAAAVALFHAAMRFIDARDY
jgi:ABC-2 type transport system permease protein